MEEIGVDTQRAPTDWNIRKMLACLRLGEFSFIIFIIIIKLYNCVLELYTTEQDSICYISPGIFCVCFFLKKNCFYSVLSSKFVRGY